MVVFVGLFSLFVFLFIHVENIMECFVNFNNVIKKELKILLKYFSLEKDIM